MAELLPGLAALARRRDGAVSAAKDAEERDRFVVATLGARLPQRRRPIRLAALAAAVVVTIGIAVVFWPTTELGFEVRGGEVAAGGYVRAAQREATLAFSDGTTIDLDAGSASRVMEVDDRGARILLERGRAMVAVRHLPGASWAFAAGPYTVQVTGTRFALSWDPSSELFELALHEGSVEVRGPQLEGGLGVRAGQHLVANVAASDVQLHELGRSPEPQARVAPAPTPSPSPAAPSASPAPTSSSPPPSWVQLIARGDYQQVLDEAQARGVEAVLGSGSADDLMALGEAARYGGDGALGRRALLALRERFAGSPAATTAAFLLGRMAEPSAAAIGWYDRYLAEAAGGAYAAEALGRKLHLLSKTDRAGARLVAKQYLAAYPKGAYAELARRLAR